MFEFRVGCWLGVWCLGRGFGGLRVGCVGFNTMNAWFGVRFCCFGWVW